LTGKASDILTIGMPGAANLPYVQAMMADMINLQASFAIGLLSHFIVLFFAVKMIKKQVWRVEFEFLIYTYIAKLKKM
jgi:fucose permease